MSSDLKATIESDFRSFDGLETLRYFSRVTEVPTFSEITLVLPATIIGLGTRGTNLTESLVSKFAPGRAYQIWHMLTSQIPAAKPRDRLIDSSGDTWETMLCEKQSLGVRWRLHCVRIQA